MNTHAYTSERVYDGYLRVNSCGKQWVDPAERERPQVNSRIDYSVYYIQSGVIYSKTDDVATPVTEGSLVLFPPHVPQDYSFKEDENTVVLWSYFSGTATELLSDMDPTRPIIIPVLDRMQFESALEKMITAYYKKSPYVETICAGYMAVLLALIAQNSLQNSDIQPSPRNENLEVVLSLMYAEYNHPIDIKKYANICCISEDHFIRLFKAYTGLPPYHYQLRLRIDRAKEMLEHTSISVTECAETVGFSSIAHFSRVFKKFTGHSPSYYKKL